MALFCLQINNMPYHIVKASRAYEGRGYNGITCQQAGVEPGKTYDSEGDALGDAIKMQAVNPVGWDIYDCETKKAIREIIPKGGHKI